MPIDLLTVLQGDAVEQLRTLPDASVHMCATSPPYWGLRDYGADGQIGLEETPDCGLHGKFRIRRDLTADQRERVARWLLDGAGCDGARGGNDGKA